MSGIKAQVKVLMELNKIQRQRESLLKKNDKLLKKERTFVNWLANLEGSAFCTGDMVIIGYDNPSSYGTVRFCKKDKNGLTWVYITTTDGRKTRRVPRNLRRLGNL